MLIMLLVASMLCAWRHTCVLCLRVLCLRALLACLGRLRVCVLGLVLLRVLPPLHVHWLAPMHVRTRERKRVRVLWRLPCVQRLRVGVSCCVVLLRLPRGVRLLHLGLPPPPVWLPLPLVALPLSVARVLRAWRHICVLRLCVLCLRALLALPAPLAGELALERRR